LFVSFDPDPEVKEAVMCRSIFALAALMLGATFVPEAGAADEQQSSAPTAAARWSGWYLDAGMGAGAYGLQRTNTTLGFRPASRAAAMAPGALLRHLAHGNVAAPGNLLLGYRYQVSSNWLLGAQTDYARSGYGMRLPHAAAPHMPGYAALPADAWPVADWFGTVRARADYTAKNWLLYATAGGVYVRNRSAYSPGYAGAGAAHPGTSASSNDWGWVAGGGVEYGWSSWSARFEYLHLGFGSRSLSTPLNAAPSATLGPNLRSKYDILRATVNYRF
jgi:opacity protein-like surface antigen